MAQTVTWDRLRELAAFRSEGGCAISLFLDLDPSAVPTPGDVASRVNALLAEADKEVEARKDELSREEREGLKRDLERTAEFFASDFSREGARAFAVFASGEYWATLALPDGVTEGVKIDRGFHLAPLAPLVGRADGTLVAVVGRERGQLFRLRAGRLEEVADLSEEQPGQHDQGGWSQARYQRHIDNLVSEHLRGVASELDRTVRRLHTPRVVLVGSEDTRSEFLETLPPGARTAVVGATEAEAHADANHLLDVVAPLLEEADAADEREALERWREELATAGRAASGWSDTLAAASDGRVELLLYEDGASHEGHECPQCGRASAEGGSCPLDGTPMRAGADAVDLAIRQTLAHGGTVLPVRHQPDLGPVDGIGALLRY